MVFTRSSGLMHADRMPIAYPSGEELEGNRVQYGILARITQPVPVSMYGSLIVTATPFPYDLRSTPYGVPQRQQQVLPSKPPRAFLPQTTNRNYGR